MFQPITSISVPPVEAVPRNVTTAVVAAAATDVFVYTYSVAAVPVDPAVASR